LSGTTSFLLHRFNQASDSTTRPRISHYYQAFSDFLSPELSQLKKPLSLKFQFQTPVNIWKSSFLPVSTGLAADQNGFTMTRYGTLSLSSDTALLFLSMILPLLAAIVLVSVCLIVLVNRITEYRKAIFLSTVEGERLSRLEMFSDLAQVPFALKTHVSELVKSAPASAHLQNKFKADVLKVISLFEIQNRKPMPQYSRWACKVRQTPFTLKNTVLTVLRQFFALSSGGSNEYSKISAEDPGYQPDAHESAGVQESFKTYLFKTIDTKFVRKVSFTNIALDQSLKSYNEIDSDQAAKPLFFFGKGIMLDDFKRDKCIEYGTQTFFDSRLDETTNQKQPQQLHVVANVIQSQDKYVLQVTHDHVEGSENELSRRIFDFVVVKSRDAPCDPRFGYVLQNVSRTAGKTTFELVSLDDGFEKLQLSSSHKSLTLKFQDPYEIDDNFIDYAFRCKLLTHINTSLFTSVS
jgi:hypothetical protein